LSRSSSRVSPRFPQFVICTNPHSSEWQRAGGPAKHFSQKRFPNLRTPKLSKPQEENPKKKTPRRKPQEENPKSKTPGAKPQEMAPPKRIPSGVSVTNFFRSHSQRDTQGDVKAHSEAPYARTVLAQLEESLPRLGAKKNVARSLFPFAAEVFATEDLRESAIHKTS
jgi:hypothetical protein